MLAGIFETIWTFAASLAAYIKSADMKKNITYWLVKNSRNDLNTAPATLSKKRLWHRCFPMNLAKFLRTPFLQNTSSWLLLHFQKRGVIHKHLAEDDESRLT